MIPTREQRENNGAVLTYSGTPSQIDLKDFEIAGPATGGEMKPMLQTLLLTVCESRSGELLADL